MTGPVTPTTVEAVVRAQLSQALGGVRGMLEAAVPTAVFTATFLLGHDLERAVLVSLAAAGVLLVVRIVQRSSPQFVLNAFVGIGIGALFAWRAARAGGDAADQALAYFLPGLVVNAAFTALYVLSNLVRWPVVGFLIGSVAAQQNDGDPLAWHRDRQVVRLCVRLTWILAVPNLARLAFQVPVYLAGRSGALDPDVAVGLLAGAKLAMGWPLLVAALAVMVWLLSRDSTPVETAP